MAEPIYEIITDESTSSETILRKDADGSVWSIPTDPANSDYAAYLEWLAAQPKKK